ncbi:hypothetical protein AnigIFM63309_001113 [Aspergillus niger]|nr:hypothetical protein AnigIFM63309_001113 [Aspergillus niger]
MWGKGESLSHLSDSDKQAIIASLDEYCVQEDWDSILLNLPPAARANFGLILVETMLNQFICTKFIDSPFWFMDGKINATDSETQSDFHKRFQYVYEKLIQVSREDAAWWKSIIVGKLNDEPCVMNNIPPTPVGRTTVKHRTALVKTYTDELMCSRLFQLLLRDPVTKYKRYQRKKDLRLLLECAAQTVIHADGGLYGNTNIVRLPDLPKFNHWSGQMIVHPFHAGFEPVEGSRVLIVTRPSYSYIDVIDDRVQTLHKYLPAETKYLSVPVEVIALPVIILIKVFVTKGEGDLCVIEPVETFFCRSSSFYRKAGHLPRPERQAKGIPQVLQ